MADDADDAADLGLSVPLAPLLEEFACPVCFEQATDARMTPCGHNYCSACIAECLNRRHACPVCAAECAPRDLIKNLHFDRVAAIIAREKDIQSKKYFEALISGRASAAAAVPSAAAGAAGADTSAGGTAAPAEALSPVESLFRRHLSQALRAYEDYYRRLEEKKTATVHTAREEAAAAMARANDKQRGLRRSGDHDAAAGGGLDSALARIEGELEHTVMGIEAAFARSIELLLEGYEAYLERAVPLPKFVPVPVSLHVAAKGVHVKRYLLQPTDDTRDLRRAVAARLAEMQNPVVEFSADARFVLRVLGRADVVVDDMLRAVLLYGAEPGAELHLLGDDDVRCKKDIPAVCFSASFVRGADMLMDYFSCRDCKFNWICRPCAENCHQGHNLAEFNLGHKPTWACCYCVKNKRCRIVNSRTKK